LRRADVDGSARGRVFVEAHRDHPPAFATWQDAAPCVACSRSRSSISWCSGACSTR
jgi:hypothetical protein